MSTPAYHSAQTTLRELMTWRLGTVVRYVVERCDVPWVREAFARATLANTELVGLYWLNGPEGIPWPAACASVRRLEDGKQDRTAVGLVTFDEAGRLLVLGRDRRKLKEDRLTEWGQVLDLKSP